MRKALLSLLKTVGFRMHRIHTYEPYAIKLFLKYKEYTMIPEAIFVDNLKLIFDFRNLPGCIVECGVWRGGMSAAMAETIPAKKVYLFDSFEGLPAAKEVDGLGAQEWQRNTNSPTYYDNCTAEMAIAKEAMEKSSSEYFLIKGWFKDTLPNYSFDEQIAVLRLDGDWYESTMDCLQHLYPKVTTGGLIIIDDYHTWDGCSRALHDFLSSHNSLSRVYQTSQGVAYIIKKDL